MTRYLRLVVALARPAALMLLAMFAAIGLGAAGAAPDHWLLTRVLVVVIGFLFMSVVVNDLADERIDRVNLAGDASRPLVAGAASRHTFRTIAVASGALAVVSSATLGATPLLVVVAGIALSLGYSLPPVRLSDRGALASLLLPFGYVAVPFLTGVFAAHGTLTSNNVILLGGLYVGFIGRILLKDFRDVRGDALFGKRTFLVRHGRTVTCVVSACCLMVGNAALVGVARLTPLVVASHMALTAASLVLLRSLSRSRSARRDEWLISAIAIVGRGMLVSLLAHLSMTQQRVGPWLYTLGIVGIAALTCRQAQRMAAWGPRFGTTVPVDWASDPVAPRVAQDLRS